LKYDELNYSKKGILVLGLILKMDVIVELKFIWAISFGIKKITTLKTVGNCSDKLALREYGQNIVPARYLQVSPSSCKPPWMSNEKRKYLLHCPGKQKNVYTKMPTLFFTFTFEYSLILKYLLLLMEQLITILLLAG